MIQSPNVAPRGVLLLGYLILFSSLYQMAMLVSEREWYLGLFLYMPAWLRESRYAFSWFQRIVGLIACCGLFFRKDFGRKLIIGIGWFTMIFVFWKHPYAGFLRHTQYLDQMPEIHALFETLGSPDLKMSSMTWVSLICYYLLEIAFWSWAIRYLSRPYVRSYFRPLQ